MNVLGDTSCCSIGSVDMKTKVAFQLYAPCTKVQLPTFDLMSMEPREQLDVSPCRDWKNASGTDAQLASVSFVYLRPKSP